MTDNLDNLQERNKQMLNDITSLQSTEKQLYLSLDEPSLTTEQKQQIIAKINSISQLRINLYSNMKDMYTFYNNNTTSSSELLNQQKKTIKVIEEELNDAKIKMNKLKISKNDKLRLIEINNYYGKRYNAHVNLIKIFVIVSIIILILTIIFRKGLLPTQIYYLLIGLTIIIGVIILGYSIVDISNRDNMNWDEYDWYFDKSIAPSITTDTSTGYSDPWANQLSMVCVGSECCTTGNIYDSEQNLCILDSSYSTSISSTIARTPITPLAAFSASIFLVKLLTIPERVTTPSFAVTPISAALSNGCHLMASCTSNCNSSLDFIR